MKNQKTLISELLLLLCALIWGLSYIAQKSAMDFVGPLTFLFSRYALGSISLIPFAIFSVKHKPASNKPVILTYKNLTFWKLAIFCGFINLTATAFVQIGLVYTDASKAGFLTSVYILIVPILSVLVYRKRNNLTVYFAVLICLVGLYFLSFNSEIGFSKGDLIVLCSSLFYAIHIILWDKYANNVEPLSFVIVEFAFASIIALFGALLFESPDFSNLLDCIYAVIFAGLFASGLSYSMQLYAQRHVNASVSALLMSTEAVFAAFGGVILLKESMDAREVLGASLILVAIIVIQGSNMIKRNSKTNKKAKSN